MRPRQSALHPIGGTEVPTGGRSACSVDAGGTGKTRTPPRFPEAAFVIVSVRETYFFFAARFSSIAAWAAARRATGTRKGEQLT